MNPEAREFVTPFHILVLKVPSELVVVGSQDHAERMEPVTHEIRTIGDQRMLGEKLMTGEYVEGPPLVIQYAELMALGCLELKPEVSS